MKSRGAHNTLADQLWDTLFMHYHRSIERISRRVSEWASYDGKLAFFKQHEIQIGIEECYRELTTCSDRFTVREAFASY
jgi:hypothetical protein